MSGYNGRNAHSQPIRYMRKSLYKKDGEVIINKKVGQVLKRLLFGHKLLRLQCAALCTYFVGGNEERRNEKSFSSLQSHNHFIMYIYILDSQLCTMYTEIDTFQ